MAYGRTAIEPDSRARRSERDRHGRLRGCIGTGACGCSGRRDAPTGTPPPAAAAPPDPNAPEVNDAGDIPDNQVFVPFAAPDGTFSVSVPEGWARSGDGSATVFTDKFNSIRIEAQDRATAADVAAVRAEVVPRLQASVPGFALGEVRLVQRRGGPDVLLTYEADSPPNPVTGKSVRQSVERYAFWHGGSEAVLTLSGAKGADNVDPWRTVTDSLRWQA
jgi:hypothetical protein